VERGCWRKFGKRGVYIRAGKLWRVVERKEKMTDELKTTIETLEPLLAEIESMRQPRSDFALRHFVVAQHETLGAQRQQVLDELYNSLLSLYDMRDEIELAKIEVEENEIITNDKFEARRAKIRADAARRRIRFTEIELAGKIRETRTLLAALNELPAYTREQYEAEERGRWERRLARQFYLRQIGDAGNLEAMRQMEAKVGGASPRIGASYDELKGLLHGNDNRIDSSGN